MRRIDRKVNLDVGHIRLLLWQPKFACGTDKYTDQKGRIFSADDPFGAWNIHHHELQSSASRTSIRHEQNMHLKNKKPTALINIIFKYCRRRDVIQSRLQQQHRVNICPIKYFAVLGVYDVCVSGICIAPVIDHYRGFFKALLEREHIKEYIKAGCGECVTDRATRETDAQIYRTKKEAFYRATLLLLPRSSCTSRTAQLWTVAISTWCASP